MVLLAYIGSFLIHVFTAYTVYLNWGTFLGIIAFLSPLLSTIVLVIFFTFIAGFLNPFNIVILVYLLLYIPYFLLVFIITKLED